MGRLTGLGTLCLLSIGAWGACVGDTAPGERGGHIAIDVAALSLDGVGDVVWDIQVDNAAGDVVWQRRVTSSGYGDSAGSASVVGPCDADPSVAANVVSVWVVGVYDGDVSAPGAFDFGDPSEVSGTALPFQNPTSSASPLTRTFTCAPNGDVAVQFDVSLARPAQQGFFDVAVSFEDLFCSAKLDCCYDDDGDGCEAGEDIALLFDAGGQRARTFVLGFACTAGAADAVDTDLYMQPLELDCTSPNSGEDFAADLTIDPAAGPGNLCTAGDVSSCAAVAAEPGVDADDFLFQVAAFRGDELLTSGATDARKVYWNVALGVGASVGACRLRTSATADDSADPDDGVVNGVIAGGVVYPYVAWDLALDATCGSERLIFGDASAPVRAAYTGTDGADEVYAYHFAPGLPAGSFCDPVCQNGGTCVSGTCDCPVGFTGGACETNVDDCDPNPCQNGGTCTDGIDSYTCSCLPGFSGDDCETGCAPGSQVFTYTGSDQSFTMPSGCGTLTAKLWGAGGGAGTPSSTYGSTYTAGGAGGFTSATLSVAPGTVLTVMVGQGGFRANGVSTSATYGGGGGTQSLAGGGKGGGRSALRLACGDVATAAGGGGGGNSQSYTTDAGGEGGGATGGASVTTTQDQSGGGATQSAGGVAGAYNGATPGTKYQGGLGSAPGSGHGTSGGGGGWYGGGGANIGGGGGGSGYVGGCGGVTPSGSTSRGTNTTPPSTGDGDYQPGVGVGGNLTGGNGLVVLHWSL